MTATCEQIRAVLGPARSELDGLARQAATVSASPPPNPVDEKEQQAQADYKERLRRKAQSFLGEDYTNPDTIKTEINDRWHVINTTHWSLVALHVAAPLLLALLAWSLEPAAADSGTAPPRRWLGVFAFAGGISLLAWLFGPIATSVLSRWTQRDKNVAPVPKPE